MAELDNPSMQEVLQGIDASILHTPRSRSEDKKRLLSGLRDLLEINLEKADTEPILLSQPCQPIETGTEDLWAAAFLGAYQPIDTVEFHWLADDALPVD